MGHSYCRPARWEPVPQNAGMSVPDLCQKHRGDSDSSWSLGYNYVCKHRSFLCLGRQESLHHMRTLFTYGLAILFVSAWLCGFLFLGVPFENMVGMIVVLQVGLIILVFVAPGPEQRWHDVNALVRYIRDDHWDWLMMESSWTGRQVLLTQDIRNSKEPTDLQVYVKAGTIGEIVGLTRDEAAPFHVKFPGFKYKVAVKLENLDLKPCINQGEDSSTA